MSGDSPAGKTRGTGAAGVGVGGALAVVVGGVVGGTAVAAGAAGDEAESVAGVGEGGAGVGTSVASASGAELAVGAAPGWPTTATATAATAPPAARERAPRRLSVGASGYQTSGTGDRAARVTERRPRRAAAPRTPP